jgi:hypothetical protein
VRSGQIGPATRKVLRQWLGEHCWMGAEFALEGCAGSRCAVLERPNRFQGAPINHPPPLSSAPAARRPTVPRLGSAGESSVCLKHGAAVAQCKRKAQQRLDEAADRMAGRCHTVVSIPQAVTRLPFRICARFGIK